MPQQMSSCYGCVGRKCREYYMYCSLYYLAYHCGGEITVVYFKPYNIRLRISWSRPVSRVLSWTIIHLRCMSPCTSSNLPESSAGRASYSMVNGFLFGLAPSGVYLATSCCQLRGALLPHPFTLTDFLFTRNNRQAVYSLLHFP
jgi:hypothetical protein